MSPRLKELYLKEIQPSLKTQFGFKNLYTGPKIEKIVLIDVPSQIYGELRKIFVFLFENSGFKDVKISESVDFEKLYQTRKIQ